jgi:hypothetical protein
VGAHQQAARQRGAVGQAVLKAVGAGVGVKKVDEGGKAQLMASTSSVKRSISLLRISIGLGRYCARMT